jgi:DNA-binding GntR family transcriptional regulator
MALYRLNRAFHEAIYVAAHNRYLLKTLQALHDSLALLGPTTLTAPGRPDAARGEHERIVAAIVARDAGAAEAAARAHIRNGFLLRSRRRLDTGS